MGRSARSRRAAARSFVLGIVVAAVLCLALPAVAAASYSTAPGWYFQSPLPAGYHAYQDVSMVGDQAWVSTSDQLLLHSVDAGRTWSPIVPTDGTKALYGLHYVTPSVAWAYRPYVGIVKTTNGGTTWTTSLSLPAGQLIDLFVLDADHVWFQDRASHSCSRTADGGTSWQGSTPPDDLEDVVFTSATVGWAVGNTYPEDAGGFNTIPTSTVYKTTDAGTTWTPIRTTAEEELFSITALDATHVLAGGSISPQYMYGPGDRWPCTVLTGNGGTSWSVATPPGAASVVAGFAFASSLHGWATVADQSSFVGDTSAILETTDGGLSWTSVHAPGNGELACNAAGDLLVVGRPEASSEGIIRRTSDKILGAAAGEPIASREPYVIAPGEAIGDLAFVDADRGWALHGGGWQVSRTTNGGASWTTVDVVPHGASLNALHAQSASVLWVVGEFGAMYKSVDAGATWAAVASTTTQSLKDITFLDADHGWVVGGSRVQTTVDGGATWNPRYPAGEHTWLGVACATASTVCAVGIDSGGPSGCIMRTTDGGATWQPVYTAPTTVPSLTGIAFLSATEGWAWGWSKSLYHTTNGGENWTTVDFGDIFLPAEMSRGVIVQRVVFRTTLEGWAVVELLDRDGGATDVLVSTTDGGATWSRLEIGTGGRRTLRSLAVSGSRVWVGGSKSTLIANFNADTAAPVTTSSYNGLWTNQSVSPILSAIDAGVGVAYTRSSLLGEPWVYGTAASTVPAPSDGSNDGAWPLVFQSVDKLAQAETQKTQLVKIDTLQPQTGEVVLTPAGYGKNGYVGPNVRFTWSGTDYADAKSVTTTLSANEVEVVGDRAYLIVGTRLRVLDVSNPFAPVHKGVTDLRTPLSDVTASGDFAYVTGPEVGLLVVDVSDPAAMDVVRDVRLEGTSDRIAMGDGVAFVAGGARSVTVVGLRDPAAPEPISTIDVAPATDVAVDGDVLCIAAGERMFAFNVGRPDRPEPLGAVGIEGVAKAVDVAGGIACVAAGGDGGFTVLVDPVRAPEVADHRMGMGSCDDVVINGTRAQFLAPGQVAVVDLTDPERPLGAGMFNTTAAGGVAIDAAGEYTYVAEGASGLQIRRLMPTEASSYVLDTDSATLPPATPSPNLRTVAYTGLTEGQKYFHLRTRDQAGNWTSSATSGRVWVDATAPTVTTNADAAWHRSFTLTASASDALSGTPSTPQLSVDGKPYQSVTSVTLRTWKRGGGSGPRTVAWRATDNVGNVGTGTATVFIDGRAPVTSDDAPRNPLDPWNPPPQPGAVTVTLKPTDAHSGVATTWYSLDGGSWTRGTSVAVPAVEGRHWIGYYSEDVVGNVEYSHWVPVIVDLPASSAKAAVRGLRRY